MLPAVFYSPLLFPLPLLGRGNISLRKELWALAGLRGGRVREGEKRIVKNIDIEQQQQHNLRRIRENLMELFWIKAARQRLTTTTMTWVLWRSSSEAKEEGKRIVREMIAINFLFTSQSSLLLTLNTLSDILKDIRGSAERKREIWVASNSANEMSQLAPLMKSLPAVCRCQVGSFWGIFHFGKRWKS